MGLELTIDPGSRGLTEEGILHIPGLSSRWVRLANGAKAHYVTAGEDGPAVILLHGGIEGSSGTAGYRFMVKMLGDNGFRVYAPDRPGFGLSDTSNPAYLDVGARAQVDFVTMFADALCIDKFHISGNSMGGRLCAQYVVSHPERVLSVAFVAGPVGDICTKPRIGGKDSKFAPNKNFSMFPFDGSNESMQKLMEGIIHKPAAIWPELIQMRVNSALMQRAARPANNEKEFMRRQRELDPLEEIAFSTKGRLDRLQIPMIYLFGMQDVLMPVENGFNYEDVLPNVQFFYPNDCGHQGQTDQPELFNQVFLEFFSTGKLSWKTAQWAGVSRRREINPRYVEAPPEGFPRPIPHAYVDIETLLAASKA